jgi:hypothetical protein
VPAFRRYIGIDYSGASTPTTPLPGLRVYASDGQNPPEELLPDSSRQRYWTRKGLAEWLVHQLSGARPTVVGIDHGFSFPLPYFKSYGLRSWSEFLTDFQHHWPTGEDHTTVEAVRRGVAGLGSARQGSSRWRRKAEVRSSAKSVFHFDVPGQVAKSTHAGLPWLAFLRGRLGPDVHFWPFDGWEVPEGFSVVAEAYPSLWSRSFPQEGRTGDQQDAFSVAAWLSRTDQESGLEGAFNPGLSEEERSVARIEGWILGVSGGPDQKGD